MKVGKPPKEIPEAITRLIEISRKQDMMPLYKNPVEDFLAQTHQTLGWWIRNDWGLWAGADQTRLVVKKFPLYHKMYMLGYVHPDGMSRALLRAAWCKVNNKPCDLRDYVGTPPKYAPRKEIEDV